MRAIEWSRKLATALYLMLSIRGVMARPPSIDRGPQISLRMTSGIVTHKAAALTTPSNTVLPVQSGRAIHPTALNVVSTLPHDFRAISQHNKAPQTVGPVDHIFNSKLPLPPELSNEQTTDCQCDPLDIVQAGAGMWTDMTEILYAGKETIEAHSRNDRFTLAYGVSVICGRFLKILTTTISVAQCFLAPNQGSSPSSSRATTENTDESVQGTMRVLTPAILRPSLSTRRPSRSIRLGACIRGVRWRLFRRGRRHSKILIQEVLGAMP